MSSEERKDRIGKMIEASYMICLASALEMRTTSSETEYLSTSTLTSLSSWTIVLHNMETHPLSTIKSLSLSLKARFLRQSSDLTIREESSSPNELISGLTRGLNVSGLLSMYLDKCMIIYAHSFFTLACLSLSPLAKYVSTPSFIIESCTPNKSLSLSILDIMTEAAYLVVAGTSIAAP